MKRLAWVLGVIALTVLALRVLRPSPTVLHGLWIEHRAREVGDELRFYYFHPDGKGLYRYGQVGHNQTHSFDWSLDGEQLSLHFRKTGERAATRIRIEGQNGDRSLTLLDDPRGQGAVRYHQQRGAMAQADQRGQPDELGGPLTLPQGEDRVGPSGALVGRIWMDLQRYATGGQGFRMYQLSEQRLAGDWRLGWHHVGDFDDWTTETLAYYEEPGALRLRFLLRGDESTTPMMLQQERDTRVLTLGRDPRNFLHRTRLRDVGRSF